MVTLGLFNESFTKVFYAPPIDDQTISLESGYVVGDRGRFIDEAINLNQINKLLQPLNEYHY